MNELQQYTPDDLQETMTFLKDECDRVPHLSTRLLVDSINGLEVVDDQLRFKSKQGIISRLIGSVDGSNRRRELIIQQTHQEMMRGMLSWVEELTYHSSITVRALTETRNRLEKTREDLIAVARYSMENRQLLEEQSDRIAVIEKHLREKIEVRLTSLEDKNEIDKKCRAWQAGRLYQGYPPIVQAVFLVDDLLCGERGSRIIEDEKQREYLGNSVVTVMQTFGYDVNSHIQLADFLSKSVVANNDKRQVAVYLLDMGEDALMHRAISDSTEINEVAPWVLQAKNKGKLLPHYDPITFTRKLQREAEHFMEATNGN